MLPFRFAVRSQSARQPFTRPQRLGLRHPLAPRRSTDGPRSHEARLQASIRYATDNAAGEKSDKERNHMLTGSYNNSTCSERALKLPVESYGRRATSLARREQEFADVADPFRTGLVREVVVPGSGKDDQRLRPSISIVQFTALRCTHDLVMLGD